MELRIVSTGSKGNCYVLKDKSGSMLMLDCGVNMQEVYKAIDFNVNALSSCLLSHVHKDHSLSADKMLKEFMPVTMSKLTAQELGINLQDASLTIAEHDKSVVFGNWTVMPFETFHDAPGSLGYLIYNSLEDMKIAYITDTGYIKYAFKNLNALIAECNFDEETIETHKEEIKERYLRVRESHMSLERLLSYLSKTDKSALRNIVLVHLSDGNSIESKMIDKVKMASGANVEAARPGATINLDAVPF